MTVAEARLILAELEWLAFCLSRASVWDEMCAQSGRLSFGNILVSGDTRVDFPRLYGGRQ